MTATGQEDVSPAEMMAVVLSRAFVDGEAGGIGADAQIPYAALRLATLTRAPNISWLCGGSGGINPNVGELTPSSSDYRNLASAEASYSLEDIVDWEASSRLDFACLGGMQIDQYGNSNMARITMPGGRTVRGPGTVGVIFMSTFKKVYLYTQRHTPRTLVKKVDFISGVGHLAGGETRYEYLRRRASGPALLVTPLAVFDFPAPERRARLVSVHPGHTLSDVLAGMGFEPVTDDEVPVTPPPSELELDVLRRVVDPKGVLREANSA